MSTITFSTRMGSLIYLHHEGQYLNPDSTSKIQIELGQIKFTEVNYDITYSLPIPSNTAGNSSSCTETNNKNLDNCLIRVSPASRIIYRSSYSDLSYNIPFVNYIIGNG